MTIAPLVFPDAEIAAKDLARSLLAATNPTATFGLAVPGDWTKSSPPHVLVAQDLEATPSHRITSDVTIRVTVFAQSTSQAKALAREADARLCAHDGTAPFSSIRPGIGVTPSRDTGKTNAELASFTVIGTVRSSLLT